MRCTNVFLGYVAGFVAADVMSPLANADFAFAYATRDCVLFEDDEGDVANGNGDYLLTGVGADGKIRRSVLWFDVAAAIPGPAIIHDVTVRLRNNFTNGPVSEISLHRVLTPWGEGTSNPPASEFNGTAATPNDATWLHSFYSNTFWTNPGGDFDSVASATLTYGGTHHEWNSVAMRDEVQNWLAHPLENLGWLLKGQETMPNEYRQFLSGDNAFVTGRPQIIISYTPIPGPGVWTVLPLVALFGRRRRVRGW